MNAAPLDPATLPHRRVLAVAPHPDDETLGCGGLLWHLHAQGAAIEILFVTDGGASHGRSPSWPRLRLAAEREREAAAALAALGLGAAPRTFLRLPDAAMPARGSPDHGDALRAVGAILDALRPDLLVLPWRRDPHCDHRDSWSLVTEAAQARGPLPAILEYAVWLDELGEPGDRPREGEAERLEFDVSRALGAKRAALAAHRTQLGETIRDDPDGFHLSPQTIARLVTGRETFWRPL